MWQQKKQHPATSAKVEQLWADPAFAS